MRKTKLFITLLLCLSCQVIQAGNELVQPWLRLNAYPAASASGEYSSVSLKGLPYFSSNPAAPASVKNMEFSASRSLFDAGFSSGRVSAARNFGFGTVSMEGVWFDFGSIESLAIGASGGPEAMNEEIRIGAYSVSAGISKTIGKTQIGASFRYSVEDLGGAASSMVSADAGIVVNDAVTEGLNFGISAGSISIPQGDYEPPMNIKTGVSYSLKNDTTRIITFGAGLDYLVFESSLSFDAGVDFNLADAVSLRASVKSGHTGGITYTIGAGFDLDTLKLDYAYTPGIYAGGSHTAGFSTYFERQSYYEGANEPEEVLGEERSYESYVKSGDYYYRVKQYRKALKYYEYINLFFWKDIEKKGDKERSALYQKMGISYYSIKDEARALHYFEQASYYDRANEILKFWIKTMKQD